MPLTNRFGLTPISFPSRRISRNSSPGLRVHTARSVSMMNGEKGTLVRSGEARGCEAYRDRRRALSLRVRGWSHGTTESICPGAARAGHPIGGRACGGASASVRGSRSAPSTPVDLRSPQDPARGSPAAKRRAHRDDALGVEMQRVWDTNHPVYGPRKRWKPRPRDGARVAGCTVRRLMRAMGLAAAGGPG